MSTYDVARSVAAFMFCSAAMTIANKQVLRIFELPLTILYIQMAFASSVLSTCMRSTLRFGSWNDVVRWTRAVPPLYALLLASGMLALRFSSMGAVILSRNVTPLLAMPIEALVLKEDRKPANQWTWASLVFVLAGAMLYMRADLGNATSVVGVFFIVLNMIAAVVDGLGGQRVPGDLLARALRGPRRRHQERAPRARGGGVRTRRRAHCAGGVCR